MFWQNKKILITGIDGFVGSNLTKSLLQRKSKVFGIIQSTKKNSLLYYENLNKKCKLFSGDIRDRKFVYNLCKKNKFDICFHLAAQVEVGKANANPIDTFDTNIKGTYNLIEALRLHCKNIKSIIVASSDKVYGEYPFVELPYKENYPLNSIYPYDVSKACADLICRSYTSKLFELPLIITRFTNIYGPGQLNFSALIPDLIRSVLLKKKFIPRGNGLSVRDFVYIDDIVHIYLALCKKLYQNKNISGQIFNAGTNIPIKIKDVIKKVLKTDKKKLSNALQSLKKYKKTPKGEISRQFMESSKIQKYIKYKPLINLDQGIEKSFRWYNDYFFKK